MKLRHATVLAAIGVLPLVACGGDDSSNSTTAAPAATDAETTGSSVGVEFNTADVEFLQGMIPHHEQAIEMADIALDPTVGASAEVVDLATRVKAAQDPEIEQMTGLLTAWGQPVQMDTSGGHDMSTMEGTMTAEQMDALSAASGAEFDMMWLESMISHHEGAIAMAQAVKGSGSNPEAIALADQIIAAQQAEITEMQALLGS